MAKPITPKAALLALQQFLTDRTEIPSGHMQALRDAFGDARVIVLEEQTLDIPQTLSDLGMYKDTGEIASNDSKTLAEALLSGRPATPACPITRQPLRKVTEKGVLVREETRDKIDWFGVDTTWRETAGYAAERNQIPVAANRVPYELRQATPPPPWPELRKAWTTLRDKKNKSVADAALVARVQARLVFDRTPEAPAAAGSSFPEAVTPPRPTASVTVSGNVQGSTVIAGAGNITHKGGYDRPLPPPGYNPCVNATGPCRSQDCRFPACVNDAPAAREVPRPRPKGPQLIYIVANASDADWVDRLNAHLRPLEQSGAIELFDERRIPPGAITTNDRHAKLAHAAMVVYMVSASLLSDPSFSYPNTLHTARLAKHVPVITRSCLYKFVFGADLTVLPAGGTPLAEASDRDRATGMVAAELLRALGVA
jgi:hypothetical protein